MVEASMVCPSCLNSELMQTSFLPVKCGNCGYHMYPEVPQAAKKKPAADIEFV